MLLDQRTLATVLALVLLLQGVGWLLIWRSQPNIPGVRSAAIAALLLVPGLLLVSLRGVAGIWVSDVLANYFVVGGLLLAVTAMAEMVDRAPPWRFTLLFYGANLLLWPAYALLVPGNTAWIAVLGGCVTLPLALYSAYFASAARFAPPVIRALVTWLNLGHALVMLLRLADGIAQLSGEPGGLLPPVVLSWFFLEAILYAAFFFIGFVALLGGRLLHDLMQQQQRLQQEAEQRRQLQAELAKALAEESAARREQRHFLDMVGHEFRTPLAIIDRAAEMVGIGLEGRENLAVPARMVAALRSDGRRLRLAIDAFLAQERLQTGQSDVRREPFDLVALLRDLHGTLDPSRQNRLVLQLPAACGVLGDADLTRIALGCLIDMAPPQTALLLRLEQRPGRAEILLLGSGWAAPEAANTGLGAGLGLDMGGGTARRLLEAQGGGLLLSSLQQGSGSGGNPLPGRMALAWLPLGEAVSA